MSNPAKVAALISFAIFNTSAVALAGGYLTEEAVKKLPADTKGSCIVQAQLSPKDWGNIDQPIKMVTTGGEIASPASTTGFFSGIGGFAFANVPKGPFRISNIHYQKLKPADTMNDKKFEYTEFNLLGVASAAAHRGDIPVEMSGTCNGGYIFLGIFVGEGGGLLSAPGFRLGNDKVENANAKHAIQKDLKGTPWEAEIDHPAESKPLAKDFVIQRVLTAAEQAKLDEAGKKSIASIVNQKHNAKAPPSDDGAVEAAAGTYSVITVNGKPMPYVYPANKCTLTEGFFQLNPDATYKGSGTVACAGKSYPFPSSGFFGVKKGVLTMAVAVGPAIPPTMTVKIAADTITTVFNGDTTVYKKK